MELWKVMNGVGGHRVRGHVPEPFDAALPLSGRATVPFILGHSGTGQAVAGKGNRDRSKVKLGRQMDNTPGVWKPL